MADVEKVLNIRVDCAGAIKEIGEYKLKLDQLKATEQELKKTEAETIEQEFEKQKELAALKLEEQQYTESIRVLNKEVQNEMRQNQQKEGSLKQMRAELSNLTKAYDELSKEDREGEVGKELQANIVNLTNNLNVAEQSTLRFYRNVGNYPMQAITSIRDTYLATGSLTEAMKAGGAAVKMFGTQLLALLANPIVAIIAAIALAIKGVVDAFQRSESQMARLKEATAAFTPVLNLLKNAFSLLAEGVLVVIEGLVKMAEKLGLVNEASKETISIEREKMALTRKEREELVKDADTENKVAKLRGKIAQSDKYNTAERRKMLQEVIKLESDQAKRKVAIAKQNYQLLLRESKLTENDAEMNQKLAEAKAAVIQADTEFYNKTRRLQSQMASFNKSIASSNKSITKSHEDRAEKAKEMAQKETEAIRAAEDALVALIADSVEKQRRQITINYTRQIDDLKKRLNEEKNLTKKAREAINQTIIAKQTQLHDELSALDIEQINKRIEIQTNQVNMAVSLAKKGTEEEYSARFQSYELQKKLAEQEAREKIKDKTLLEAQLALIQKQYDAQVDQLEKDRADNSYNAQMEVIKKRYTAEIAEASNNQLEQARLQAQWDADNLAKATETGQLLYETHEQYENRILGLKKKSAESQKKLTEEETQVMTTKFEATSKVMGGLADVFEELGEKNKAFAKLSKVLALGEIAVNTGKALAAGIAQSQSVPFPANIAAIATTVASVLAGIASAISTVKSAKFKEGGVVDEEHHYATGGSVRGAGSGTSDSVSAKLSNGESVLTSAATSMFSPLLSAMNQIGGGVPINAVASGNRSIGEDMLARAVARGVASMPNPVVSVEEINKTNTRVSAIESLATI